MKHFLISCLVVILFSHNSFAQLTPLNVPVGIDINNVKPSDIPSSSDLKNAGATDAQIEQLTKFKNQGDNTTDPLKQDVSKKKTSELQDNTEKETNETPADVDLKVKKSTDEIDKIFGHSFFKNNNIKFYDKANQLKAPDNYILGVGDELSISIWGYSDFSGAFTIDDGGAINPKLVGRIYLKGLTFKDAKGLIASKFKSVYDLNNSQIDVTLTFSRVITVNIVGEVNTPGAFTIPAINTAFNALVTVGGIRPIGSVRKIHVKRGGQVIKTLDVYEYLMNPDSKQDFFLENNDYIFVPSSGRVVEINGQVKRPFGYELIEKENLKALVDYAGGFEAGAYKKRIQIQRFLNSQETIMDIDFDSLTTNKKDFVLFDGDKVLVRKIPTGYSNYVELLGSVKLPGNYELKSGDRISDIILKAEGVSYDVFDSRAYVIRLNPDLSKQYIAFSLKEVMANPNAASNIKLQNLDVIKIFSKSYFKDDFKFSVIGAVRSPGDYNYGDGLMLKDALYLAGGLRKEAAYNRIEVSRAVDFISSSGTMIPIRAIVKTIEIGDDLRLDQNSEVFAIQPFDQIMVRTEPKFELQKNIFINGEVMYSGEYAILNKNEKISDVLKRAGGITTYAFPEGATLKRSEFNEGFLFFKLQDVLADSNSKYNYIVKEGDILTIPKIEQLIQLTGAIKYPNIKDLNQISAPYTKRKSARYYIKNYGLGFDKSADKKNVFVVESGGNVRGTKHFLFIKRYPKVTLGSNVVVPSKPIKEKDKKRGGGEPVNWNKAIENITVKLTGLATLYVIFSTLSK